MTDYEPISDLSDFDLLHLIHMRLAILDTLMDHPWRNRCDIQYTSKEIRRLTAEYSRRFSNGE